ncbi:MAG: hypothetical protein HW412_2148 [Bacteroidetes bacterium]|nr:hypothetical protein [Bacteroidota bacterium]MBM2841620.1 hypothetical protein [Bacteroidota bacterium]
MKRIHFFLAIGFAATFVLSGSSFSQEQSADHLFVSTTFHTVFPEGGRMVERDSLMEIYHKQVTEKNPLILSQRAMQHFYGHDSHDMIVVTEYKSWADIDAADTKNTELFEKYWATEAARRQYNRMLNKYFTGHADEIYSERTKLRK